MTKLITRVFFTLTFIASQFNNSFAQGDDCTNALNLPNVSGYCSNPGDFTNVGSTQSSFTNATCWPAAASRDVWFQFTAIGTDVSINVYGSGSSGGTMNSPSIALYSGSCNTTINQQACANGPGTTDLATIYKGGLTIGATYYIRVTTYSSYVGTFKLCVNNFTPPISVSADCYGAGLLCNKGQISNANLSGGGTDVYEPAGSCLDDGSGMALESNSAWYYWQCDSAGTLTYDITPFNAADDIDWVLYELDSNDVCLGRTIIRCNASACFNAVGSSGLSLTSQDTVVGPNCNPPTDSYCSAITMVPGKYYALMINNWSTTSGFDLSFGGTGTFAGPHADFAVSSLTLCQGSSITFNGSASTNYDSLAWNFGNGSSPSLVNGTGPHTVRFDSTYFVNTTLTAFTQNGCPSSSKTVTITVAPKPVATINGNNSICLGNNTTLFTNGVGTYSWSNGASTSSIAISPTITSTYSLVVTNASCSDTSNMTVTVSQNPTVTVNSAIQTDGTAQLTASGGGAYQWTPVTGLSCSNCANPVASPEQPTTYCVKITNTNNCSDSTCLEVSIDRNCGEVFVPNAFSPNNDGTNDLECVFGNCIQSFSFSIYDRWGEKVFETTDPKTCWDGTFNGKALNTAVFAYFLEVVLINGEKVSKKGNISIIK